MHYQPEHKTLVNIHDGKNKGQAISAVNAGLAISSLNQLYWYLADNLPPAGNVSGPEDSSEKVSSGIPIDELRQIITLQAEFILKKLKDPSGGIYNSYLLDRLEPERSSKTLASQCAVIQALINTYSITAKPSYLNEAKELFDYLEKNFWEERLQVYKSDINASSYIYSPLNTGLCLAALRQLLTNLEPLKPSIPVEQITSDRQLLISRIGSLCERIFDQAGLQAGLERSKTAVLRTTIGLTYPIYRETGQIISEHGDILSYEITVINPTDIVARDLKITQILPEGITYLTDSGQINGEKKNPSTSQPYVWKLGDLKAGEKSILKCQFQITTEAPVGKNLMDTLLTETNITGTTTTVEQVIEEIHVRSSRLRVQHSP